MVYRRIRKPSQDCSLPPEADNMFAQRPFAATPQPGRAGPSTATAQRREQAAPETHSFTKIPLHAADDSASGTGASGMPGALRSGIESLSGVSMEGVNVHYNSAQPAQISAHAYAQGRDIHLAPGQEQHLPHEAWHLVQQAQGRVQPTRQLGGQTQVNDDPALEREADQMGAQALSQPAPDGAAPQMGLAAPGTDAPVQGVFIHQGTVYNPSWIDTDDNHRRYVFDKNGPGNDVHVAYIWLKPLDGKGQSRAVYILPNSQGRMWAPLNSNQQGQLDMQAQSLPQHRDVMMEDDEPTQSRSPNNNAQPSNMHGNVMEDSEPINDQDTQMTGAFTYTGQAQPYMAEIAHDNLATIYSIGKLITNYTAQVGVIPLAKGSTTQNTQLEFSEMKYAADQVLVNTIMVSDTDRPDTRFKNQESHTVAWTLVRKATMALANRTVSNLLAHFSVAFGHLAPFSTSPEAEALLQMATQSGILTSLKDASLPIDRWQALMSSLLKLYAQVYQISDAATYKRGKAKGHGEAAAMAHLEKDEECLATKQPTRPLTNIKADVNKLLDVQFRVDALGVQEYAFAVHHWIDSLHTYFPNLMGTHGHELTQAILDKKLAKSFRNEVDDNILTVSDLLTHFDYNSGGAAHTSIVGPKHVTYTGISLPEMPIDQLRSNFVANIALSPGAQGSKTSYKAEIDNEKADVFDIDAFTAAQVQISAVSLGDQDRPKTQFLTAQKSHTVAWTLGRHQILAYKGRSLAELLALLAQKFQRLLTDITNKEGLQITKIALSTIENYQKGQHPIHDWQSLASMLVRWYYIAYQVADSSSYVNPTELDRALGHGEATHMLVLHRSENSLQNGGALADTSERIIGAATALMDVFRTKTLDAHDMANAYQHWKEALTDAFPLIMAKGGANITKAMLAHMVDKHTTLEQAIYQANRKDLL